MPPPPYSNTWASTKYPGSMQARDIDDRARELSLAIEERMETFLVKDWNADPIEPHDSIVGKVTGKKLFIGHDRFQWVHNAAKVPERNAEFLAVFHDSGVLQASVNLPIGAKITRIEALVDRGDIVAVGIALVYRGFAAATAETVITSVLGASFTISNPGPRMEGITLATPHTVVDDQMFFVRLATASDDGTDSMQFWGVRITYDSDNNTISI